MKRPSVSIIALSILSLFPGAAALAAQDPGQLSPQQQAQIEEAVSDLFSKHAIPALSLALVSENKLVFARGFGTLKPQGEVQADADTLYRLASVSKPVTAVAVLQLVEKGLVQLDQPAREYCKAYPKKESDPTVRHLLAHQSGIPHTSDAEDTTIRGEFPRLEGAVPLLADKRLKFRPGERMLYTSWGYALLGCVIEGASGLTFWEYVEQNVLKPSAMKATVLDSPAFEGSGFAPGFRMGRQKKLVPSEVVDTRFKSPASGLISTVSDLARFVMALYERKLLNQASLDQSFRPQTTSDGNPTIHTLGWLVGQATSFGQGYYYGGSMEGTTAFLYLIPSRRFAVVLLSNRERFVNEIAPLIAPLRKIVLEG